MISSLLVVVLTDRQIGEDSAGESRIERRVGGVEHADVVALDLCGAGDGEAADGAAEHQVLIDAGAEVPVAQADFEAAAGGRVRAGVDLQCGCGGADDGELLEVGEDAAGAVSAVGGRKASGAMASESGDAERVGPVVGEGDAIGEQLGDGVAVVDGDLADDDVKGLAIGGDAEDVSGPDVGVG